MPTLVSDTDVFAGHDGGEALLVYLGDSENCQGGEGAYWAFDPDASQSDDEELVQALAPYTHPQYVLSPLRALYRSLVQTVRRVPVVSNGSLTVSWQNVPDILDPYLPEKPGQFMCRLDVGYLRPGKDQPSPMVAGRAPDRVALLFCDPATDAAGRSLLKAGDRIVCLAGPDYGTWELRMIPEVAKDYIGAHHMEIQVVEVSQALQPSGLTPFPGQSL